MSTTMLYRPALEPNPVVWDLPVEHRIFPAEEVDQALTDGWARHPRDVAEPEAPTAKDREPKRKGRTPKEA